MPGPRLILASASPRRAEILRDAGFTFKTLAAAIDETPHPGESPSAHVKRLAVSKALAAAARVKTSAIVIGADTVVVVGGKILGKPKSRADSRRMLRLLSGRSHRVLTGLAVLRIAAGDASRPRRAHLQAAVEATRVWFAPLTNREIADYVATGEPADKAGAYAIQGRAGKFVTRIEGDYFNVVGLPLARLNRMLA